MRDWILAALLAVAFALITCGVNTWTRGGALITAGVLLVVWVYLIVVVGEAFAPKQVEAGDT